MRVNVYAEEMTDQVALIEKEAEGNKFVGLRFWLHLPVTTPEGPVCGPFFHGPEDNDSSAVTFWGKQDFRKMLRLGLDKLDEYYGVQEINENDLAVEVSQREGGAVNLSIAQIKEVQCHLLNVLSGMDEDAVRLLLAKHRY